VFLPNSRAPGAGLRPERPVERRLSLRDGLHGLVERHAEHGDEEVDGVAGAAGFGFSPKTWGKNVGSALKIRFR
jgi:hypothetical protein